jgi:predicted alpha/beta hydrolase
MGIDRLDGAITRFPAEGNAWGTVVLAGAMSVKQDFYAPAARYLARSGANVVTFDYAGVGRARVRSMRHLDIDVIDWARDDAGAALAAARAMGPSLPVGWLGHSLGGQILALVPGHEHVRAAVTVTAGSGYYKLNDSMPLQLRFFWFGAMPVLTPLFGYFPGRRLRMVGDLPRNVARQWRRWCLHPDYLLCEGDGVRDAYARVASPILAYSFTDDVMINGRAVERMHAAFREASVEFRHVDPASVARKGIGHFGFFQLQSEPMWHSMLAWLQGKLTPA